MQIFLADGGAAARFALWTLLEQQPGWQVVGEVASADLLLDQVGAKKPDLLLLDWNLPELIPAESIRRLHQQVPATSIIILSGRPEVQLQAISAGADDFVSKGDPPDRLLAAISSLSRGIDRGR
jgi:DNA-binding NarL/FixJ family response regulator